MIARQPLALRTQADILRSLLCVLRGIRSLSILVHREAPIPAGSVGDRRVLAQLLLEHTPDGLRDESDARSLIARLVRVALREAPAVSEHEAIVAELPRSGRHVGVAPSLDGWHLGRLGEMTEDLTNAKRALGFQSEDPSPLGPAWDLLDSIRRLRLALTPLLNASDIEATLSRTVAQTIRVSGYDMGLPLKTRAHRIGGDWPAYLDRPEASLSLRCVSAKVVARVTAASCEIAESTGAVPGSGDMWSSLDARSLDGQVFAVRRHYVRRYRPTDGVARFVHPSFFLCERIFDEAVIESVLDLLDWTPKPPKLPREYRQPASRRSMPVGPATTGTRPSHRAGSQDPTVPPGRRDRGPMHMDRE
jgi:hypothetical protein